VIAQGRFDVVCPAKSAWDLHKKFPEAELHLVGDSGHTALEPGTVHVLVEATERFKARK
jgi:proline iminopeptidase